jgi:hypothetical protein
VTEPLVDPRELLRGLHKHNVGYVVTGAVAMTFYGYVRLTEDLDVIIDPDPENLDRVADWLISIRAALKLNPKRPFGARGRWGMKGSNATVLTSLGQVDVVQRLPGLPEWRQLLEQAEVYEIEDMRVPVISRTTLIEQKRLRGSHLNLADIEAIESLEEL